MRRRTNRTNARSNTAIAILLLAGYCGACSSGRLPSELKSFPADLANQQLGASGIYDDGWTAPAASVNLQQPSGSQVLSARGIIAQIGDPGFSTEVALMVDGKEVGRRTFGIGEFQLSAPVQRQPGKRLVTLNFSSSRELPGGDGRTVGGQLKFLGFEPARSAVDAAAPDIVTGGDIRLANGWGPLEIFANERFRWVDNDAQIVVTPPANGDVGMIFTIEAGPGVGGKCLVKVLDASGRQVGAGAVEGRGTVKVFAPMEGGRPNEFKLHVDGGGKPAPNDARVLNFRVFRIESATAPK
jgi:hypothetical protein